MKMNYLASVLCVIICFHDTSASRHLRRDCNVGSMESAEEASRRFAYKYYSSVRSLANEEDNIFLAPTAVATSLAMIHAGAAGTTRDQILDGLQLTSISNGSLSHQDMICMYKASNPALSEGTSPVIPSNKKKVIMRTVARIFGEKTCHFQKDFTSATRSYGQKMKKVSFSEDTAASLRRMNHWVSKMTNNTIRDLFSSDDINRDTKIAFVSAVYFQAHWRYRFWPDGQGPFHVDESRDIEVNYMTLTIYLHKLYSEELDADLIELPYGERGAGTDVSMIILLPKTSMAVVEARITEGNMNKGLSTLFQAYAQHIRLKMPKIHVTGDYDLKQILTNMGMVDMFDEVTADLSGMVADQNLFISAAVQKTYLKVDEFGTEAAGAGGFGGIPTSLPEDVDIDRPFITMIYEKKTKTILFIGRVIDPTSG